MSRDPLRYGSDTSATPREGGVRLGIGAGPAIAKLVAAVVLTALLVVSFAYRWNPFLIIVIGLAWAIVLAGLIIAPLLSNRVADALGQHGLASPRTHGPPPPSMPADDPWDGSERRQAPRPTTARGAQTIGRGPGSRPEVSGTVPGFDWAGLIEGVADRLEDVLGEGFTAHAEGTSLVLRHGDEVRRVNLGLSFQPPPLDVGERALRGCLRMMDEAQMFSMRVRRGPWPSRQTGQPDGPASLARPRVRLEEGEIRMAWADSAGTLLRLPPLRFGVAAPGSRDSNW